MSISLKETLKNCLSCKDFQASHGSCINTKHPFEIIKFTDIPCPDWVEDVEVVLKGITVKEG